MSTGKEAMLIEVAVPSLHLDGQSFVPDPELTLFAFELVDQSLPTNHFPEAATSQRLSRVPVHLDSLL